MLAFARAKMGAGRFRPVRARRMKHPRSSPANVTPRQQKSRNFRTGHSKRTFGGGESGGGETSFFRRNATSLGIIGATAGLAIAG
mmetsp:Transcript_1024/g.1624  ORF Transcript_1024/g.1624 Transcript_1024/m.1624 type:complete len:85 (+) Transcript_1024:1519-1773(+)